MNDSILTNTIDSLASVRIAQIEADKEIALAAMQVPDVPGPDLNSIIIVTLVIFLPVLIFFVYMGYRAYLKNQRKSLNDELIVRLAEKGQTVTPEMIESIRREEQSAAPSTSGASSEAYNKLCMGGAMIIGGLVVLFRNRILGILLLIAGLFIAAQGLALWLSSRSGSNGGANAAQ